MDPSQDTCPLPLYVLTGQRSEGPSHGDGPEDGMPSIPVLSDAAGLPGTHPAVVRGERAEFRLGCELISIRRRQFPRKPVCVVVWKGFGDLLTFTGQ